MARPPSVEYVGFTNGRATIIAALGARNGRMHVRARCSCGAEFETLATKIVSGSRRSCGCWEIETRAQHVDDLRLPPFWSRATRGAPDECWSWHGLVDKYGYGKHGNAYAHRVAYTEIRGAIPAGLSIDHLCCNKLCVNPAHMEPVTHGENSRRAWARRRGLMP